MSKYETVREFQKQYEEAYGWQSKKLVLIEVIEELIERVNDLEWEIKELKEEVQGDKEAMRDE